MNIYYKSHKDTWAKNPYRILHFYAHSACFSIPVEGKTIDEAFQEFKRITHNPPSRMEFLYYSVPEKYREDRT